MKLRIEDNTLRLRLSQDEVGEFAETGRLATTVPLAPGPDGTFTYALQRTPDDSTAAADGLRVAYTPGRLTVLVPAALAQHWVTTEEIGLSAQITMPDIPDLRILVEKDLGCKH